MLLHTCCVQHAILLETSHPSLLPWVEKYIVREVPFTPIAIAVGRARMAHAIQIPIEGVRHTDLVSRPRGQR